MLMLAMYLSYASLSDFFCVRAAMRSLRMCQCGVSLHRGPGRGAKERPQSCGKFPLAPIDFEPLELRQEFGAVRTEGHGLRHSLDRHERGEAEAVPAGR